MNTENKVIGFRKMGIVMGTITALIWKPPTDFRVSVIVGIIAIVGITAQTYLDRRKNE